MNLTGAFGLAALLLTGLIIIFFARWRWFRFAGIVAVVISTGATGFFLWQAHSWGRDFNQVRIGDHSEQVRLILGPPTKDTDATIGIYNSKRRASDIVPNCAEQYWYYPFFAPECWWIAFDARGRVLTTYHYVSP